MPHLQYLALMLLVLALALGLLARRRTALVLRRGSLGVVLGGAMLAVLLGRGGGVLMFRALGLFAWTVFAVLPIYLALGALLLRRAAPRHALVSAGGALVLLLIAADAFLIEPRWLEVSRVRIETSKLSRPVRVAVIADIQTDRVGAHERRALELALAERPDLVLLAGDYVSTEPEVLEAQRAALRRVFEQTGLSAPLGVYAVRGNCDRPGWEGVFDGLPVHVFEETGRVELDELAITGLTFSDSQRGAPPTPESGRFELVLGHAPDFALAPTDADLLVAGHCHGGQVRLPFFGPIMILSRVPRAWASGTREIRPGTRLCVSRGIGMERLGAPPLRFLCRPEVVVIDLVPR